MLIDLSRRLPDWLLAALAGASEFRAFGSVPRNQTWITLSGMTAESREGTHK